MRRLPWRATLRMEKVLVLYLAWVVLALPAFCRNPDPQKGMQVFSAKGCARCHAILGEGARIGPDLARAPSAGDGLDLAAAMWGHGPKMWQRMYREHVTLPRFETEEMEDLFAFLAMVSSLEEPGNAEKGRRLFQTKNCVRCHSIRAQGAKIGPDLASIPSNRNPVGWITAMWNHGPRMFSAMAKRHIPYPQFQGSEMADLHAYIRTARGAQEQTRFYFRYLRPPSADLGETLFRTKRCIQCHSVNGYGGSVGPDLSRAPLPRRYGEIALVMWNHAPQMHRMMSNLSIPHPQFEAQELADLLAYLSSLSMRRPGDMTAGAASFAAKGCSNCHAVTPGKASIGPNLTELKGAPTPVSIASTMWNHGPAMLQKMKRSDIAWPVFTSKELANIVAYLKSIQANPPRTSSSQIGRR